MQAAYAIERTTIPNLWHYERDFNVGGGALARRELLPNPLKRNRLWRNSQRFRTIEVRVEDLFVETGEGEVAMPQWGKSICMVSKGEAMKFTPLMSTATLSLLAALTLSAQSRRYTVADLGTLPGGSFSQATYVNRYGLVTGIASLPDGTQHAILWYHGAMFDLARHASTGANSAALAANDWGQVLVQSETRSDDPNNENFCSYFTGHACRAFVWQNGTTTLLPTIGGTNASPSMINNRGQSVGIAENAVHDASCPTQAAATGSGPLTLDFEAVLWEGGPHRIRELDPLPGDRVGMAFWINERGQAVGGSGSCADSILPGPAVTPHAVLWENGTVTDMGNLGGSVNTELRGIGTIALSINNRGQAVGAAALAGNNTGHAFLWSKELGHMVDLGTIQGDVVSAALGINDRGHVVGPSLDGGGNPRAFLFRDGAMKDLNSLVPPGSIYMLIPYAINDEGLVAGFGVTSDGEIHGFLASPCRFDVADAAWCRGELDGEASERPRPFMTHDTQEKIRHSMHTGVLGNFIGQP
jgi:probable HAF family extracellular repeat protein